MTSPPFYPPQRPLALREKSLNGARVTRRPRAWSVSRAALFWFLLAFWVRLGACVLIHFYSLALGYGGYYPLPSGADDTTYFPLAERIYEGLPVPFISNDYPYALAIFYRFTGGPDLLVGKLLNVFAGAVTVGLGVLLVQELTREGFSRARRKRAIRWTGLFLTFYPSLLWYSTQLVKDPLIVVAGMGTLYFQICLLRRFTVGYLIGWLVSFAALFPFRPYAAIAIAVSLLIYVLRFKPKWLVPALVTVAVLPFLLGKGWFGLSSLQNVLVSTDTVSSFRESGYSTGGSSAGITINYSNPLLFLLTYSYSFATAMFGPFPWQIRAAAQAVALPEAMVMWALFPIWLRAVWKLRHRGKQTALARRPVLLLLFSLVLIGAIAIFSDNIGANTRLRLLPWGAFLLYASLKMPRVELFPTRRKPH